MPVSRRHAVLAAMASPATLAAGPSSMPQVPFGGRRISRLIVGGNPISGNSHVSPALSREMGDYFTVSQVKKLLRECQASGINTWQSRGDRHILRLLNEYRLEGGQIQWIGQTASELADIPRNIREMAGAGAVGVYHHGSRTDSLWAEGKIDHVRETLKVIRQTGVQVGLGTHIPEVVDYVESRGWDLDFYMTAVYNLTRTPPEAARVAGKAVEGEFFWDADRERMLERVRQVARQCLIFKVYGAGRKCATPAAASDAIELVFRYAKASDCVVIGMFPKYREQVRENCRLVAEAASRAGHTRT